MLYTHASYCSGDFCYSPGMIFIRKKHKTKPILECRNERYHVLTMSISDIVANVCEAAITISACWPATYIVI